MSIHNQFLLQKAPDGGQTLSPAGLAHGGPCLNAEVRIDVHRAKALTKAGSPVPTGRTGMLLVDTGASMTCVDRALLVALGAPVIGDTMVQTPSGSELQQLFACGIAFPGSNVPSINKLTVCGSNLSKQGIIGLLGRDVLSRALLIYNGIGGFWTLSM